MRLGYVLAFGLPTAVLASMWSVGSSSGTPPVDEPARNRCASRVALSLTGQAPSTSLLASTDPQSEVATLLASPAFAERFARFINSQFNAEPATAATPEQDSAYYLAKHILTNNRPWHELFDGPYNIEPVAAVGTTPATARVVDDANGLGYFRSRPWMVRYAGNEQQGYRLNSAFRIQQNIIGLDVSAVTNAVGTDTSANGRLAAGCRSCHYDSYFALDKVAKILSRRDVNATTITFIPSTEPAQALLDGRMIANDKELVQALVSSTDHQFRTCRLAFMFLYGRPEASCETALFDACIDAYTQTGDIRAALSTIVKDDGFCE